MNVAMEINLRYLDKEEVFNFVAANPHLFRLELKGENNNEFRVVRRKDNMVVAECNIPENYARKSECNKYTLLSLTTDIPVRMEIPCCAKPGDYMWYCGIRERNEAGYYFDTQDICQVKITDIWGVSDCPIRYSGVDIKGTVISGTQALFHHSLEEIQAFMVEANKFDDVCDFFHYYQVDYDKNRKNKKRFPYLLVNNQYLINGYSSGKKIRRIGFNSSHERRANFIQFQSEWYDDKHNAVARSEELYAEHKSLNNYGEFTLNDGRIISNIIESEVICWDSFEWEDNK